MITFLRGKLVENWPNRLVIDVNGVGYEVLVPLAGSDAYGRVGSEVKILTHLHIREQEHTLFGFPGADERDLFRLLMDRVSGVGPKVAMAVLSGMSAGDFKAAVVSGDLASLASIKGLGRKTAERIVLELKDKVGVAEAWEAQTRTGELSPEATARNDALLALISLGYKQADAQKAIAAAAKQDPALSHTDEILRGALRLMQ
ncbi:MAG: Holliday junction branch migration protein RuvA [Verrucomicrobiae bacterium]|nr:Holliday junction branch migration protein RuvA [Verrucomicrobiae bacterium]MCP5538900.1 Holliday junction branch migration protein RuvA [Akkermansiaceae bacterium]